MADSTEERISRLMEAGLRHYGEGRVRQAAGCWREALHLDPEHGEARDYLRNAGIDADPFEPSEASGERDASLLADALELFRKGEAQESLELFETLARENPLRMERRENQNFLTFTIYLSPGFRHLIDPSWKRIIKLVQIIIFCWGFL